MKKLILALVAFGIYSNAIADDKDHVWTKAFVPDYTHYLPGNGHTLQETFTGNHDLFISNPTDHPITYHYTYVLCINTSPERCEQNGFIKTLIPGQIYQEHYDSHLTMQFTYPGKFFIVASTQLEGEFNARTQKVSYVTIKK